MQVLDFANDKSVSTWQDDSGSYIRGFLISTKTNKNNWKIANTSRVNDFVGKDFAVIPHRIGDKSLLDGHVGGSKDEVLNAYSNNSYGKIVKVLGPFEYGDGDLYWEHITKLTNNKVASALFKHGAGTLVPFATSPHIFAYEGNDMDGWDSWEPAGVVLVGNPAFGEQSVITKSCHGQEIKCYQELAPENKIAAVTQLISSFITSDDSKGISMDTKDTLQVTNTTPTPETNLTENSTQVQESKQPVTAPEQTNKIITDEIKPTTSTQEQSEEVKILKQKIADMEDEKKQEILNDMFSVYSDEKERERLIKEISKANDLNTIKYLKGWIDILAPLHKKQGETEATKAYKAEQEKELATFKKNKIASTNYKFQLPGEPKEPEKEDNKVASTQKIGEIAEFQRLLKGVSA